MPNGILNQRNDDCQNSSMRAKKLNDDEDKCKEPVNVNINKNDTESKQYKCDTCESEFLDKRTYLKHKKTHVNEIQKVVCDVCGGNYKDTHTLKVHTETQHLMVNKPFTCEICGDKFKTKVSQTKNKWLLKAHIKTHKTVKDFKCPHCPKTFNFQFILEKHIRIHTNERP